jgi:hypothetical protein
MHTVHRRVRSLRIEHHERADGLRSAAGGDHHGVKFGCVFEHLKRDRRGACDDMPIVGGVDDRKTVNGGKALAFRDGVVIGRATLHNPRTEPTHGNVLVRIVSDGDDNCNSYAEARAGKRDALAEIAARSTNDAPAARFLAQCRQGRQAVATLE